MPLCWDAPRTESSKEHCEGKTAWGGAREGAKPHVAAATWRERALSHGDTEQDNMERDRRRDKAHSVLYSRMQACTPGLHGGPQR